MLLTLGFLAGPRADGRTTGPSWGQMPSAQGRWESAAHGLLSLARALPSCWREAAEPGMGGQVTGRQQRSGAGGGGGQRPHTQAANDSSSYSLAATLKESKTQALRPLYPPRGCRRPSPGPHCPTWPSGSLLSLGATCSRSPALLCLHQATGMSSSHPSVSASQHVQHGGLRGHDLPLPCRAPAYSPPPWGRTVSSCGVGG